jgi:hypothetical protein
VLPCILVWSRQDTKTIGLKLKILESGYMIVIISLLKHYIVLKKEVFDLRYQKVLYITTLNQVNCVKTNIIFILLILNQILKVINNYTG